MMHFQRSIPALATESNAVLSSTLRIRNVWYAIYLTFDVLTTLLLAVNTVLTSVQVGLINNNSNNQEQLAFTILVIGAVAVATHNLAMQAKRMEQRKVATLEDIFKQRGICISSQALSRYNNDILKELFELNTQPCAQATCIPECILDHPPLLPPLPPPPPPPPLSSPLSPPPPVPDCLAFAMPSPRLGASTRHANQFD